MARPRCSLSSRAASWFATSQGGCIILAPNRAEVARGVPPAVFGARAYTAVGIGASVVPKSSEKDPLVSIPTMATGPEEINALPCTR